MKDFGLLFSKPLQLNSPAREVPIIPAASDTWGWQGRITGGEHINIREMTEPDITLYREFISNISPEDLHLRFFATGSGLIAEEEKRLSHRNALRSAALVAIDSKTKRMLGLARLEDDAYEARSQFAILVRSDVHGHGVGWQLMKCLISYAKAKGLRCVYGEVLTKNRAMLQMCRQLGFRIQQAETSVCRAVLDLTAGK